MTNAVIMFIGDSITFEMYASLVHLTGGKVTKRVHIRAVFNIGLPIVINTCGNNNVTLIYRWSKYLAGGGTSVPIQLMLEQQFPVMIVMNTGSHYQDDNAYRSNMGGALNQIRDWQQLCRDRMNITCPFFWRTTPPGAPNCMTFTKPVNNIYKMEDHLASNPIYNWEKFRYQNDMALQILETADVGLNYEIIDGYEIGIRRPDVHASETDCLHSNGMAVGDAYSTVLLHHLSSSRTMEDVSKVGNYSYNFSRIANVRPDGGDFDWNIVNG